MFLFISLGKDTTDKIVKWNQVEISGKQSKLAFRRPIGIDQERMAALTFLDLVGRKK